MTTILRYVLALFASILMLNQVRRPTWGVGRLVLWAMGLSHSGLTDWGLEHVPIGKGFTVLDVGCGGGRTIEKLAAIATDGKVYGVDCSSESVAVSRGRNARLIEAGRVEIRKASVSQLPLPDDACDLVTAIETQYYWPDLIHDMREVLRVLKPGGTLIVIAESYDSGRFDKPKRVVMSLLRSTYLSPTGHRELFAAAGYSDVRIFEEKKKGWICGVGRKPSKRPTTDSSL
jgi:ubiquinone/menaquinone biosynthesis C-methylase UbiE